MEEGGKGEVKMGTGFRMNSTDHHSNLSSASGRRAKEKPNPALRIREKFIEEVRSPLRLDNEQDLDSLEGWDRGMDMYKGLN